MKPASGSAEVGNVSPLPIGVTAMLTTTPQIGEKIVQTALTKCFKTVATYSPLRTLESAATKAQVQVQVLVKINLKI